MNTNQINNIPAPLKTLKQWVCFKLEPNVKIDEKPIKVPMIPGLNVRASIAKPGNWRNFDYTIAQSPNYSGIGFVFTANDSFTGIDIDHCRNPETGELSKTAEIIMKRINCYTEISFSKTGIHIITNASALLGRNKFPLRDEKFPNMGIEIYSQDRYFIFTGERISPTSNIYSRNKLISSLHAKLMKKYPDAEDDAALQKEITPPKEENDKAANIKVNVTEYNWHELDLRTLDKKLTDYKNSGNDRDFEAAYNELTQLIRVFAFKFFGKKNVSELSADMILYDWGFSDNNFTEWLTEPMLKSLDAWNPNRLGPKKSFKNYLATKIGLVAKDKRAMYFRELDDINKNGNYSCNALAPLQLKLDKWERTQRYTCKDEEYIDSTVVDEFYTQVLSKRQAQILKLLVEGYNQKEIAAIIGIGRNKIADHLSKIQDKAQKYFFD